MEINLEQVGRDLDALGPVAKPAMKSIERFIKDLESRREWADAFENFEPGFQIGYLNAIDWAIAKAKQCDQESK